MPGGWVSQPFSLIVFSDWQSCNGTLETAIPGLPLSGLAHTGYGRYVLPLQAPLISWNGASSLSVQCIYLPSATGLSECLKGLTVSVSCAPRGQLDLPLCL